MHVRIQKPQPPSRLEFKLCWARERKYESITLLLRISHPIDCNQVRLFYAFPTHWQMPTATTVSQSHMSPASITASSTLKADITAMQNGDRTQGDITQGNLARSRKSKMNGMWL